MPRIRSLKPEAPQHRKVGRLSIWARWLWLTMITQADDHGRLPADPGQLRLLAFGYDEDVTIAKVSEWLAEIAATGLIGLYTVHEVPYAYFPSLKDHQRIDRPSDPKYPPPPELRSTRPRRSFADRSSKLRLGSEGSEGREGSEGSSGGPPGRPDGPAAQGEEQTKEAITIHNAKEARAAFEALAYGLAAKKTLGAR
jgi:hypothetical protein